MKGVWAALCGLFTIIIGLWKWLGAKAAAKRARVDAAAKKIDEGVEGKDAKSVVSGFDRLNNDV